MTDTRFVRQANARTTLRGIGQTFGTGRSCMNGGYEPVQLVLGAMPANHPIVLIGAAPKITVHLFITPYLSIVFGYYVFVHRLSKT